MHSIYLSKFMLFAVLAVANGNSAKVRHVEVKAVKAVIHLAQKEWRK